MKPAIHVENLSKSYRLGAQTAGGYRTLRETISDSIAGAWHNVRDRFGGSEKRTSGKQANNNFFWALKDVSFEVQPGEVIGVIGKNGAGKSTLLKILSRVTEPSEGRVELRGRVGSLLEVGTGFHTELTGRENIYLNGSILGMKHREIARKFDDIVSFAEIERFLDTPVKRYSSGMFVRLAFAVAAFLEPEILVVDEVLAVGDAAFQQRCLTRIREVAHSGATVFFVSHNMGTVVSLCRNALVLHAGQLIAMGDAATQVRTYMETLEACSAQEIQNRNDRTGNGAARITKVALLGSQGSETGLFLAGESLNIHINYVANAILPDIEVWAWISDENGNRLTLLSTRHTGFEFRHPSREGTLCCSVPTLPLPAGRYYLDVILVTLGNTADQLSAVVRFDVQPGPFFKRGRIPSREWGVFLIQQEWNYTSSLKSTLP